MLFFNCQVLKNRKEDKFSSNYKHVFCAEAKVVIHKVSNKSSSAMICRVQCSAEKAKTGNECEKSECK